MIATRYTKYFLLFTLFSFALAGCAATDEHGNKRPYSDAEKGVALGATIGALLGLTAKNKKQKVLLYGAVGGLAGGLIGNYMDKQKKDFEKQLKGPIDRGEITITKLPRDILVVTMTAQTAFDVNSSQIKPGFYSSMDKIAKIVKKYGKTHLSIVGHTDSTGSRAHNQTLSVNRAKSVSSYLRRQGIIDHRLAYYGMGEDKPRADNSTKRGRTLNRRVEIAIDPVREGEDGKGDH